MTILIATVTSEAAWLTQDTAVNPIEPLPAATGSPPAGAPLFNAVKHQVVSSPGLPSLVLGGNGNFGLLVMFADTMRRFGPLQDFLDIGGLAPAVLAYLHRQLPVRVPSAVCALGWSRSRAEAAGFVFVSGDAFKPVKLPPGAGHTVQPAISGEDTPEDVRERWEEAASGYRTEAFHRDFGRAIHGAWLKGSLPNGAGCYIGGELVTVRAGSDGVSETRTPLAAPDAFKADSLPV